MRKAGRMSRWMTATGCIALAAGFAVTANAIGAEDSTEPMPTLKLVDAEGVEVEINPEDLSIDPSMIASLMGGGSKAKKSDSKLASWKDVSDGFTAVPASEGSLYKLFVNKENGQMLAELPRGFERQRHFFAMTVASGEIFAGLQSGEAYVYWKQYGPDRIALVEPQISVRSTGDRESKNSVDMIFTDRVILDMPILCKGPSGQPVIDMDQLLVGNASTFFGGSARGLRTRLAEVAEAKGFPENIEVAYTVPDASGTMKTFHYSISEIKGTPGYKPRRADERLGYFVTNYRDLGQFDRDDVNVRYINRWHIEKADPKLKMSPPKEPIVYYVDNTVPVRYRRWVRAGVEYWNEAFRNIGIDGAIEVRFQDATTGAHMDKDPEDVRYNFIRWLSNDISTAIGPSRVNPMTGEILDADVVLTDGWIRVFTYRWEELLPDLAMEGFSGETMNWLAKNPQWDPRVRLAGPTERARILAERQAEAAQRGVGRFGGEPSRISDPKLRDHDLLPGNVGSKANDMCRAAVGQAMSMAMIQMHLEMLDAAAPLAVAAQLGEEMSLDDVSPEQIEALKERLKENPEFINFIPDEFREMIEKILAEEEGTEETEDGATELAEAEETEDDKPKKTAKGNMPGDTLDGIPEAFVGPALAELVAHEVGHTIGLRHNFKGSSAYELEDINSDEFKGKKPWSASVMDYNGVNIRMPGAENSGTTQGDYSSINIGPYDMWVIEYGYTPNEKDLPKILSRVAEPELQYATDEDTAGPDPLARRYDLSADPLEWCNNQMELVRVLRKTLLDHFVEDGESWAKSRQGYNITLNEHVRAVSAMANWIGGVHVFRDKKGDPNGRAPIQVVDADQQRDALNFVVENTFYDDAFGLTPEMLEHMTVDKWWDQGFAAVYGDAPFAVHDQILGIQSAAMSMVLNPTTLRRVLDNEYRTEDKNALTVAEVMRTVTESAWDEVANAKGGKFTERKPMISSLRRNLQREHLERFIDLSMPDGAFGSAEKPVATLASMHLRGIHEQVESVLDGNTGRIDDYSLAHLMDTKTRIEKALDAQYIYNAAEMGGGGVVTLRLGQEDE